MYNKALRIILAICDVCLMSWEMKKMYANLKKYTFCMDKFVFLRYSVNKKGLEIDEEMVKKLYKSVQQQIEREEWTICH